MSEPTYSIYRFFAPHLCRTKELIRAGLTLEEAQRWCNYDSTHEKGVFFDGYIEE